MIQKLADSTKETVLLTFSFGILNDSIYWLTFNGSLWWNDINWGYLSNWFLSFISQSVYKVVFQRFDGILLLWIFLRVSNIHISKCEIKRLLNDLNYCFDSFIWNKRTSLIFASNFWVFYWYDVHVIRIWISMQRSILPCHFFSILIPKSTWNLNWKHLKYIFIKKTNLSAKKRKEKIKNCKVAYRVELQFNSV